MYFRTVCFWVQYFAIMSSFITIDDSHRSYLNWEQCQSKCHSFMFCFWKVALARSMFSMYM